MIYRINLRILPFLSLFVVLSCSPYSFSGSSVPGHIKTIAIPLLENNTAEFGLTEQITDALLDDFIKENILQIVDQKDSDSVMKGTIVRVSDVPYTFDENEEVQEFRVTISAKIVWYDKINQINLFEGNIKGWGIYAASTPEDRIGGLDDAVERLVTEVLNQTLSGW
ncbi:MAG: LptE family protein [Candidatus Marinimicrobia bacterium]|nr:LptE family protein [Candidatus Neomarinimicrobiota bacterium]